MNTRDRVKQSATHTSGGLVFSLSGGAAADGFRTFLTALGSGSFADVPVLVERANGDWEILTATVDTSVAMTLTGVLYDSSTGSALALDASEEVLISLTPSAMVFNAITAKTLAAADTKPVISSGGLLAIGAEADARNGAVAIGAGAQATLGLLAFGPGAKANAAGAVSIGSGLKDAKEYAFVYGPNMDANNYPSSLQAGGQAVGIAVNFTLGGSPVGNTILAERLLRNWYSTDDSTTYIGLSVNGSAELSNTDSFYVDAGVAVFEGRVMAVSTTGDMKVWKFKVVVRTELDWSDTDTVGTPEFTVEYASAGASTWDITTAVNAGANRVSITATGAAGVDIVWNLVADMFANSVWA